MECNVCYELINESRISSNKRIKCDGCEFVFCCSCVQKFIISKKELPSCMNCKKEWNYNFISKKLQKKFINGVYKKHLEDILYKKEQSKLSEFKYNIYKHYELLIIKDCLKASNSILCALNIEYKSILRSDIDLRKRISYRIKNQSNISKEFRIKKKNIINNNDKLKDIISCSYNGCNGMLNNNLQCILCKNKVCIHCYKIKNNNHHVCDIGDLNTLKEIKTNTKICPGCSTLISKIDGCDQMFCTICNTPFCWKSGKKEYGKVHNPHYFNYLREKKLNNTDNDTECVTMNIDIISFKIREPIFKSATRYISENREDISILYNTIERKNHMKYILKNLLKCLNNLTQKELPYWEKISSDTNNDLRKLFLLKSIDEKNFKKRLLIRFKRRNKMQEVYIILNEFSILFEESIRKLWLSSILDTQNVIDRIDEITYIRNYYNKIFLNLSKEYNLYTPYISNTYKIYSQYKDNLNGNFYTGDLDPECDRFLSNTSTRI